MQTILEELKTSTKPITKIISHSEYYKVIAVGLHFGTSLKKHKAPGVAKILVVHGTITYTASGKDTLLTKFHEHEIPLDEYHEVTASEPSVFLLMVTLR